MTMGKSPFGLKAICLLAGLVVLTTPPLSMAASVETRLIDAHTVATGRMAVKTPQGFYVYVDTPELNTPAKVIAKAKSAKAIDGASAPVPIRLYKQSAVDEPYVKPGYVPTVGSRLSTNVTHLLSRTEFAWTAGLGSRSVSVAVLDDPLPEFHPSLSESYDKANAYDVRNGTAYRWLSPDDVDPSKGAPRIHGVEVAGVVASDYSKNVRAHAVHGVAPSTSIMPITVCCFVDGAGNETRGSADDVAISNGILYAARLTNSSGNIPSHKADAIVLSYDIFGGQPSFSAPIADAIQRAVDAGVLFVTGSGNGGRLSGNESTENTVSALPGVVVVSGAELSDGRIADFSTRGTAVDLAASFTAPTPSVEYRDGAMDYTSVVAGGTSYAAPYVAGLYALAKATYPALTPSLFSSWINADQITFPNEYLDGYDPATNTNVNRSGTRDSDFGYGIIDAKRTINAALSAAGMPTVTTLPALTPTLSIQNASNANSFQVFATIDNPLVAGGYLSNVGITFTWDAGPSSTYPSLVGHTSTDQISGAELCSDSVGARQVKAQTDTTLSVIGFSILPTPQTCAYAAIYLVNGYYGDFTVRAKAESFFAPSGSASKTFKVGVAPPADVIINSFTADRTSITTGQSVTFNWSASNATGCTFAGFSRNATDSYVLNPPSTQDYALTCTGSGAPATKTITITVTPPATGGGGSSGGGSSGGGSSGGGSSGGGSSGGEGGGGGSASLSLLAALELAVIARRRRASPSQAKN